MVVTPTGQPPCRTMRASSSAAVSSESRQLTKMLVERDWIVPHPHAGRIVDRVRDRRAHATQAEFPHALGLHRRRKRILLVEENHLLMRNICVDRHLIPRQIV